MMDRNYKTGYWEQLSPKMVKGQDFDQLLAGQYRQVHLNLLAKWADVTAGQIVLKTDLFAEALSFQLPDKS